MPTRVALILTPTRALDTFLNAAISDENDGAVLTVLSLLARRDADPWEQAAALALLPAKASALTRENARV